LEGAVPEAWLTSDLSRTGVVGDSRAASDDLGATLKDRLVQGWRQLLSDLLNSDWPPRSQTKA
jgi:creatinine amidohydrolase